METIENKEESLLKKGIEETSKKFVGQEEAIRNLFTTLAREITKDKDEPSFIFLDGPSGSGKTAILNDFNRYFQVPVGYFNSAILTKDEVKREIIDMIKQADDDIELAEHGIVVFDEFQLTNYARWDKEYRAELENCKRCGLPFVYELKGFITNPQQTVVEILKNGAIELDANRISDELDGTIDFNTSHLTFVCIGALSTFRNEQTGEYIFDKDACIEYGYDQYILDKVSETISTKDCSRECYLQILKESNISPIKDLESMFAARNKTVVIPEEVYEMIANTAIKLGLGARGLLFIVNKIKNEYIEIAFNDKITSATINPETVKAICDSFVKEKSIKQRRQSKKDTTKALS